MNAPARRAIVFIFVVLHPTLAWAEAKVNNESAQAQSIDLSVPESPAFTALGLSPQSVTRPASTQELAATVLNGVDKNGNFQSGLALDVAPYQLLFGDTVSLKQYQQGADSPSLTRILWRSQTSAATAKGTNDADKSVRLALGIRVTPWDRGDPRLDGELEACLRKVARSIVQTPLLPESEGKDEAERSEFRRRINEAQQKLRTESQTCRDEAQKRLWNNSSWALGAAPSWISTDGSVDRMNWDGGILWTSIAYGFEDVPGLQDAAQLILHGRYRGNEQVPDPKNKGKFFEQNSVAGGARLRFGNDKFAVSIEALRIFEDPVHRRSSESTRASIGVDIRLSKELWLEVSVGGEGGRRDGNNQAFVLGSFKWGTTKEPKLTITK